MYSINYKEEIPRSVIQLSTKTITVEDYVAMVSKNWTPWNTKDIVEAISSVLNSINNNKKTLLHKAIGLRLPTEMIREFLRQGADVNAQSLDGFTPMHFAVNFLRDKHLFDVLKLLIDNGAIINVSNEDYNTPLDLFIKNINKTTDIDILHYLLKNGAKMREYNLKSVIGPESTCSLKFRVFQLLLEFGVKPYKEIMRFAVVQEDNDIKWVKLLMQYVIVYLLKQNPVKVKMLAEMQQRGEILNLCYFAKQNVYKELINYRKALIDQLIDTTDDKLDRNNTLFTFLSVRCLNGLTYKKYEETLLLNVLRKFQSKKYKCCNDLFFASVKDEELLSMLCNSCIYVKESTHKGSDVAERVIYLNRHTISHLASFLSKSEIMNLILSYRDVSNQKEDILNEKYFYQQSKRRKLD